MKAAGTVKKLICTIIITALIATVAPFTVAHAASAFTDVNSSNYFYTEVTAMYEQGAVNGYGDGTFLPQNSVKTSEALKLVCSMAGVAYVGSSGQTDPWYSDVVAWAKDKGIVASTIDPNKEATREDICRYIVAVYKLGFGTATDAFTDTDSQAANILYDYGVIKGISNGDGTVSFGGAQLVKRCDTCIMLYRLNEKVTKPNWAAVFALDRSHYNISKPSSFTSFGNYVSAWSYMLATVDFEESFTADISCTETQLDSMMDDILYAYNFAVFDYMEYASFLNQWEVGAYYSVDSKGNCVNPKFTLRLSNGFGISNAEISKEITSFNASCAAIVTKLYNDGSLQTDMTAKEKAHVIYVYTAYNTKYDTSCTYYNGYDAAVRGTAVCQGYTAMYNYLCNLAGVRMETMTGYVDGDGHAWSRINVGGVWYNIDSTWGDPIPDEANYCDETWFWVTDSFLKSGSDPRSFDSDTLIYG